MGIDFHNTRMGRDFYTIQLPRLIKAIEGLNSRLDTIDAKLSHLEAKMANISQNDASESKSKQR